MPLPTPTSGVLPRDQRAAAGWPGMQAMRSQGGMGGFLANFFHGARANGGELLPGTRAYMRQQQLGATPTMPGADGASGGLGSILSQLFGGQEKIPKQGFGSDTGLYRPPTQMNGDPFAMSPGGLSGYFARRY